MAKKENGSGNIRKRKDGSWEARYCIGTDPGTGKVIRQNAERGSGKAPQGNLADR